MLKESCGEKPELDVVAELEIEVGTEGGKMGLLKPLLRDTDSTFCRPEHPGFPVAAFAE